MSNGQADTDSALMDLDEEDNAPLSLFNCKRPPPPELGLEEDVDLETEDHFDGGFSKLKRRKRPPEPEGLELLDDSKG
jgi:hypothetical protein